MKIKLFLVLVFLSGVALSMPSWAAESLFTESFEEPEARGTIAIASLGFIPKWAYFNSENAIDDSPSGMTNEVAKSGRQALWFTCPESKSAGYYQGYSYRYKEPVPADTEVSFTVHVMLDAKKPLSGDVLARLCVAFMSGEKEIKRIQKDLAPEELSKGWKSYTVSGLSNQEADAVIFSIVMANKVDNFKKSSGGFYADDATMVVK